MPREHHPVIDTISRLQRFERGQITEAEYLDRRVTAGMAHVRGRISAERYEMIRETLFELLETDPVLEEMKRRLLARGRQLRDPNCN
jgi:hypothetical protein